MRYLLLIVIGFSPLYGASWFAKKATAARIATSSQVKMLRTELERLSTALKKTAQDLKNITLQEEKDIAQHQIKSLNESIKRLKSQLNLEKQILAQKEQTPLRKLINKDKARLALQKRASQAAAITAGAAAVGGTAYGAYTLATLPNKEESKEALPTKKESLDYSKTPEQFQQKESSGESDKNTLLAKTPRIQKDRTISEILQQEDTSSPKANLSDADSFLKTHDPANNWQQDFSSE